MREGKKGKEGKSKGKAKIRCREEKVKGRERTDKKCLSKEGKGRDGKEGSG